jgi:hypothetical protein
MNGLFYFIMALEFAIAVFLPYIQDVCMQGILLYLAFLKDWRFGIVLAIPNTHRYYLRILPSLVFSCSDIRAQLS